MSDDLISRKDVIIIIENMMFEVRKDLSKSYLLQDAKERISQLNTAFNKEKVIDELEYDKEMSAKYSTGLREQGHIEAFDEAISIVKKGGINNILL